MGQSTKPAEMLDSLLAHEIGVESFMYDQDIATIRLDVMRILEQRSKNELFDQKFGKFILDHIEVASLDADRVDLHRLISTKPHTVDSKSSVPVSQSSIVSYPLGTGKRPIIP